MEIVVCCKLVPDLAEELEIDASGAHLDPDSVRLVLNEFDEHALEEALLIKEATGSRVTVIIPDADGADNVLYTAIAKGADRAIKLLGVEAHPGSSVLAGALASVLPSLSYDVILTGVQSIDDVDGQLGGLLAGLLGLPYVSVVTGVEVNPDARHALVRKEFSGGLQGEYEVDLPAVFGIQAAKQPPRYAPVSKIRQAMREAALEEITAAQVPTPSLHIRRLLKPEAASQAEFIEGTPEEIASRLMEILEQRKLLA